MCSNAITSVFSGTPKVDKPAPAPTIATPDVQSADDAARQRQARAVNQDTNTIAASNDLLDPTSIVRPKLLGN